MAFGTPVAGAVAYSALNGTSVAPAYPSGILATDQLVMFVGMKPSTANGGTLTQPTGWTIRDSLTGAGGYGTTLGADSGNTNLWVLTKDTVTAGQTGTQTVTIGTNNVSWAFIVRVPTGGGTISYGSSDGQDTTAGNVSVTLAANPGLTADDFAIWAMCIPTDVTTPSQFSAHAISATGATFATPTELNEPDSGTGNDIGGFSAWTTVSTGTASVSPTITATAGGTTTNVRGPLVLLRMRETLAVRTGDLAATEDTVDVISAPGGVLVQGSFAVSEVGDDTFAASGAVTDPAIVGTLAATEIGDDTLAAAGVVLVQGTLAATETGSDTLAATSTVLVQGTLAATETGSDTLAATGDVIVQGTFAVTEDGADTFLASGGALRAGTMAAQEVGADTFVATGAVLVQGTAALQEVGDDTFAASGGAQLPTTTGDLAAQEVGDDTAAGAGTVLVQGDALLVESGEDVFSAAGAVVVAGDALLAEAGSDVFEAVEAKVLSGDLVVSESGSDTFGGYYEPGYVEPGYIEPGVTGTVSNNVCISGAQALLLFRICQLHGLVDPLAVSDTSRVAGSLSQSIAQANGAVTITTVAGDATVSGSIGALVEDLAALHGLTGPLTVTSSRREAGYLVQVFNRAEGVTTVTRQ